MILKLISELLYEHECVIVPELGAFISKEKPATMDYANHRLTPPSRDIAFNSQIVTDDGLLAGRLKDTMRIGSGEAARLIHDFAMQSLAALEVDGELHLDGIGTLKHIGAKDYVLDIEEDKNFLGDAFGLASFSVQPVYRSETYQHLAEQIATEQKRRNMQMTINEDKDAQQPHRVTRYNYKWFRAAAYSMMVAMVLMLLGWGAGKSDAKFASWNPFFYASPNEFIAKHLNETITAREIVTVDILPAKKAPMLQVTNDVYNIQPVDAELLKPVDVRFYYIIGGSLNNERDASKCLKNFKKQGFDAAEALPKNAKGNIRVAYEQVMGLENAVKRLEIIKKEYNEAAWLLRKK